MSLVYAISTSHPTDATIAGPDGQSLYEITTTPRRTSSGYTTVVQRLGYDAAIVGIIKCRGLYRPKISLFGGLAMPVSDFLKKEGWSGR